MDLHSALEAFEQVDALKAQIVKLKFFVGLTTNEIAETTQLSVPRSSDIGSMLERGCIKKWVRKGRMTNTHQQTDEEIFTAALAFKSIEEQNRFVAMTVAGDDLQRDRVLSLLASHRKLNKVDTTFVLDRPEEVCNELMMGDDITIGEQVGPYRIMQLLVKAEWIGIPS